MCLKVLLAVEAHLSSEDVTGGALPTSYLLTRHVMVTVGNVGLSWSVPCCTCNTCNTFQTWLTPLCLFILSADGWHDSAPCYPSSVSLQVRLLTGPPVTQFLFVCLQVNPPSGKIWPWQGQKEWLKGVSTRIASLFSLITSEQMWGMPRSEVVNGSSWQ